MTERRRTVLVTGSTDGIGKATALALARAGRHVIVHGRNRPRVDAALAELRAAAPDAELDGISFDLGTVASVKKGVKTLLERVTTLDVLINNAGIFAGERVVTEDGVEATFAVNHLGHFLLTELLTPVLLAAGGGAKVIDVASVAHVRGRIHLDDLTLANGWTGYAAYAQAKLAQVMHARSLADKHPADQLAAYSLHPGVIATKLLRQGFGPVPGASPELGARTAIALATGELTGPSGSYFSEGKQAEPAAAANDAAVRAALWKKCEELAGLA
jgi:NAD(P)-dependent dehydrogenase (short-subunit alcohol dehydrogenase family)